MRGSRWQRFHTRALTAAQPRVMVKIKCKNIRKLAAKYKHHTDSS
jgi:hypothetical protein